MEAHLQDQRDSMVMHLDRLKLVGVMPYDPAQLKARIDEIPIGPISGASTASEGILFDYRIFPKHIMSHYCQWHHERREMRPGDTIVQQVFLPPTGRLSLKMVFGVRVKDVFREEGRTGFSYETLEGHVERGISTFLIERVDNSPVFRIATRSGPGHWTTRLAGPIVARPYQRYCTLQALAHVQRQFKQAGAFGG